MFRWKQFYSFSNSKPIFNWFYCTYVFIFSSPTQQVDRRTPVAYSSRKADLLCYSAQASTPLVVVKLFQRLLDKTAEMLTHAFTHNKHVNTFVSLTRTK
jgi:hypothetical protein